MRYNNSKTNNLIKDIVILGDFVVLDILFYICLYFGYNPITTEYGSDALTPLLVVNMAMAISQYFYSTIIHIRRSTPEQVLRQVTFLVLLHGAISYIIADLIYIYGDFPASDIKSIVTFTVCLYLGILASRYLERWGVKRYRLMGRNTRNVVFVGSDSSMIPVYEYLVGDPSMGYHVCGYYSDTDIEDCPDGLERVGTLAELDIKLSQMGESGMADELYCSLPVTDKGRIRSIIRYCNSNVVHFYYIPAVSHIFGNSFKQERIGETMVFTNHLEPLMVPMNKLIKRTFDIVMSAMILLCLLPFIPFIALIIKVQSPGPIFFCQARTGLNGRNFNCYKFRSMHVNKDADRVQATENDPRKFAFGNFMRKSNVDELPQFFNVLIGDMSIVGPRPHMLFHTETYRQLISDYMVRHFVKPGITGWAQVTGFRGETKELWQMKGRVKRDIWYIENWSIWLDLRIIWKTAKQIFVHDKNAY